MEKPKFTVTLMRVPVNEPVITDAAKRYVIEAMESGWVSSAGKYIDQFEEKFAKYLGVKHAVTTTSGTSALHVGLLAMGIGEGDEVIVPNFTMIASVFAVIHAGAKPVFVDCESDTFTIDISGIEEKITKNTKAVMPVHIYGHPVDMDPLLALAKRHNLQVIEDAAEVHGARYKGRLCGSIGDVSCFSFYGNKIITTGEGGMIVTDDDMIASHARSLKDLAHSPQKRFTHEEVGYNFRMTNLQAACGLGQLESIEKFLEKKQWMAREYEKRLQGIPGLRLPVTKEWAENVYWMYAVLLEEGFPLSRDALREALKEKGVDTRDFFQPCSSQPALRHLSQTEESFPVTEHIAERGLYLPSGLALTKEQIEYVCEAIREVSHCDRPACRADRLSVTPKADIQKVSVILPTYNEAGNIIPLIAAIDREISHEKEIIVVDDNSPDRTWKLVQRHIDAGHSHVRLERRMTDRGLTKSIRHGIECATGDTIVWMDCDFSMPPEKIPALLRKIEEGYDIAVGSRFAPGGSQKKAEGEESALAIGLSTALNTFTRWSLHRWFYDYTSGFIAIRRRVFDDIRLTGDYGDYFMDLMYRAILLGYSFIEIPYTCVPRREGESKTGADIASLAKNGSQYFRMIARLWAIRAKHRMGYSIKDSVSPSPRGRGKIR